MVEKLETMLQEIVRRAPIGRRAHGRENHMYPLGICPATDATNKSHVFGSTSACRT